MYIAMTSPREMCQRGPIATYYCCVNLSTKVTNSQYWQICTNQHSIISKAAASKIAFIKDVSCHVGKIDASGSFVRPPRWIFSWSSTDCPGLCSNSNIPIPASPMLSHVLLIQCHLFWETACLEGPHIPGRRSHLPSKTTCLERPRFISNGTVLHEKFYCLRVVTYLAQ